MEDIISEPRIVKSHDITLDAEYAEWIAEVKHRYRSAQVKAAVRVKDDRGQSLVTSYRYMHRYSVSDAHVFVHVLDALFSAKVGDYLGISK